MKCSLSQNYERTLSELTQLTYAAALDPQKWQLFLERASELCGGIGVHLFGHDDVTNSALGVMYGGYDPIYTKSFDEYYGQINSWAPGFFKFNAGVTVHTEMMCPQKDLVKTEFYNDWCKPQGDLRTGGGVILYKETSRMFAIGANIRKSDSDRLDAGWLRLVTGLTPHLQQALEISRTINGMALEKQALASTRSPHDAAVLVVTSKWQVAYANNAAWAMLEKGTVIKQTLGGQFDFSHEEVSKHRKLELLNMLRGDSAYPIAFRIADVGNDHYTCRVVRHTPNVLDFAPMSSLWSSEVPFLMITLAKHHNNRKLKNQLMAEFAVTNAEAEVVFALAGGETLGSIALHGNKSIHTVRNQLKRAMSKLDVNRQADLVAYVEGLKNNSA